MAKNALQDQLLKLGLVNAKQVKKADKQAQHAKKTGQDDSHQLKTQLEQARLEKLAKDQALDHAKQQKLEQQTLKANIIQMIAQHAIKATGGEISYNFIDQVDQKIKKLYVNQAIYNALVKGSVKITRTQMDNTGDYAFLPAALAEKIEQRMQGFVIHNQAQNDAQTTPDDDPYAAYVIPDDLMW